MIVGQTTGPQLNSHPTTLEWRQELPARIAGAIDPGSEIVLEVCIQVKRGAQPHRISASRTAIARCGTIDSML